jgi:hypothetical protein
MHMASQIVVNGQVNLLTPRQILASQGKAFVVTNPTPGTAIAYANQTSYSATANGLFTVSNNASTGGKQIVLDELMLLQTATAPTGTLVARFEVFDEAGIVALTSAAAARTPVNLLGSGSNTTVATVTSFAAGAGTVAAAVGTRRLAAVIALNIGVSVIHDQWIIAFGQDSSPRFGLTAARATDNACIVGNAPPIVIAPQHTAIINAWTLTGAANVPSYEFALKYFEIDP